MTLQPGSSIVSVIPHLGRNPASEAWLGECLDALLRQQRPIDTIAVVDDDSPCPPVALPAQFPQVAFLRTGTRAGPFAILDAAIARTPFDALLFQDSDDWSLPTRLRDLLRAAAASGAELVGCQVRTIFDGMAPDSAPDALPMPLDPRAALLEQPTLHSLLLPSSLLDVALARRLGGLSSGLRFGADSDFVRRAVFGGKACNVETIGYVRRVHPDSLTRCADTGLGSPARSALQRTMQERARQLVDAVRAGVVPDLSPLTRRDPIKLSWWSGPRLSWLEG